MSTKRCGERDVTSAASYPGTPTPGGYGDLKAAGRVGLSPASAGGYRSTRWTWRPGEEGMLNNLRTVGMEPQVRSAQPRGD